MIQKGRPSKNARSSLIFFILLIASWLCFIDSLVAMLQFLLIALWHAAASAAIECIESIELLLISLLQLRAYHTCHIADTLHNHDLTDAVVLTLQEAVVGQ